MYDHETAKLIDESGYKIDYSDKENEQIYKTQNLKGLLEGKSVCKGHTTEINALAKYFGIKAKTLSNSTHLVTLDLETREDDLTCYFETYKAGILPLIDSFLTGSVNGLRFFDLIEHHELSERIALSPAISTTQKINLLGTNWSQVTDWNSVDINKTNCLDTFMNQLHDFISGINVVILKNYKDYNELKKIAELLWNNRGDNDDREL